MMNLPPQHVRLRQYANNRDGMTGDPVLEATFRQDMNDAADAVFKLAEAVKLFERIRQFVGQEVDGSDRVALLDAEIAIDKFCAGIKS